MSRSAKVVVVLCAACSSPSATLVVTTGGEDSSSVFAASPAVATIELDLADQAGDAPTVLFSAPFASSTTLDLGQVSQESVGSIQFDGRDSSGDVVVFGALPYAEVGALDGQIPIMVQRRGSFARWPTSLPDGRRAPFLAITNTALYVAGGTIDGASGAPPLVEYDLLNLVVANTASAPQAATSFALIQFAQETYDGDYAAAFFLDDTGETLLGLNTLSAYPVFDQVGSQSAIPWPDYAGGQTVLGEDDSAYVVAASRTSSPSSSVFVLLPNPDANGNPAANTGSTSTRQGAAVAWAPSRGVFLYGGNVDSHTSGVEILSSTLSITQLDFPADTTQGLAAIALDDKSMLIAGDGNAPRAVDLTCGQNCVPTTWGVPTGPALTSPSLWSIGDGAFLLVGDDPSGDTQVIRIDTTSATPVPLKIARQGARATQTLWGTVLIVGGGSDVIESYVP